MSSKFILKRITAFAVLIAMIFAIPQQSFGQVTVTKCENTSVTINSGSASMLPIDFVAGDFPTLTSPEIADIEVEVTWTVEDNACGSVFTGAVDLTDISFSLTDPATGTQVYANPGDWTGNTPVNSIVTTFNVNGSALPAPAATGDYLPGGFTLDTYGAQNPLGSWVFNVSHNGGGSAPVCVQSVCITITACETAVNAVCQSSLSLTLDPSGNASIGFADIDAGSSTSCLLQNTIISQTNFTCADVGTNNVDLTLETPLFNSTCTTPVTVVDNTPPDIAECGLFPTAFDTVYVDGTGTATLDAATAITSTDACGVISELLNLQTNPPFTYGPIRTFDCTNLGRNEILLVATDVNGNEQVTGPYRGCQARVYVFDTVAPTALCRDRTLALDASGELEIDSSFIDNGSFDNCASAILDYTINGADSILYTCANLGVNNVTMIVTNNLTSDRGGVSADTCTATVTIIDNTPPTASCANLTVDLDPTGNVTVDASTVAAASVDNCGPLTYTFSTGTTQSYNCSNLGPNPVSVTVTDPSSNTATCSSTITIQDVTPPTMVCSNATVTLASGTATVDVTDIDGGSFDACPGGVTLSLNSIGNTTVGFTCADVGPQTVELIGEDASGNRDTCTATVMVVDAVAPTALCQAVTATLDAAGVVTVTAAQLDAGSSDDCALASVLIDGTAIDTTFTCAEVGVQPVTLVATDQYGNTANCIANVTVEDTELPTISCQPFTAQLDPTTGQVTVSTTDLVTASGDNCGVASITINGVADTTFNCAHVGTNLVTVVIEDVNGNTANCVSTVTVEDNTLPTLVCNSPVVQIGPTGTVTVVPADIDGGSSDNCGIASLTFTGGATSIDYDCSMIGNNSLTLIATDVHGNVDSCIANVVVADIDAPTAVCQPADAFLDASGSVVVPVADIDGGSSDNCAITVIGINGGATETYGCANIGPNNAVLEVADAQGNASSCLAVVTVQDTISPTLTCQNITVQLDPTTGQVTVAATAAVATSNDNCGIASTTLASGAADTTFNCANIGNNTIDIIVTDGSGNSASCSATITVEDVTPPAVSCTNISVTLDASGIATVTPAQIDGGTVDNCGLASLTFTGGATTIDYDCSMTGANNLTLVATDVNGNVDSCVAVVTVSDGINPTAICQNHNAYLDGAGLVTVVPADVDGGSFDNCSIVSYTINNQPSLTYNCTNISSPQNVTLEVTDPSGNTNTCIATVTVLDTVSPVASCQATPVVAVLSPSGTVNVNAASINDGSSDNCGTTTLLINGLAQETYTCAELGLNTATLTVTDGSGNSSTCTAQVDVQDNLPPLALCASPTVYLNNSGLVTVTPAEITDPASSDNCGITNSTINGGASVTYTCADITAIVGSPMTATLELSDASGNTASCPASITVVDTISPQALCKNIQVQLDPVTGQATVTGLDINSGSSDNCNIVSYLINGAPSVVYSCADIGNNIATLTVEDESGNSSTCTATIEVVDATAPTATCQNITVYLDNAGQVVVNAAQIDGGSSDNCSPLTLLINNQPTFTYTCAQAGLTVSAQLSVADPSGNTTVCIAQVTVLDTISPVANCNTPLDVYLGTAGTVTMTATQINAGSTDNCSITSVNINGGSSVTFDCTDVGANSVTLTVRDGSSNTGTCVSTVNVFDTLSPTAICRNLTAYLDGSGQVVVNPSDVNNGSIDNCGVPSLDFSTGGPITYDCTMTGSNNATLIVTDASGNVDSCTSIVTVLDTVSPVALCQDIVVQLDPTSGTVTVAAAQIDGGSSDNCAIANILINGLANATYDCSDVGANTATLTVIDASGNTSTCTATITVEDVTPPAMLCQDITVQLDASGNATVVPGDVDAGTSDNCAIASLTLNGLPSVAFDCSDVGVNNVTLIATDVNGNIDSCTAQVTVQDTVSPIASCLSIDAFLDASGAVTIFPTNVDGGSSDNCAVSTLTVNGGPDVTFGCADVGPQNVVLEVTDVNGNTDNCTAVVTVRDTILPTVLCTNITVQLDPVNGDVTVSPADVDGGSFDNCGIASLTLGGAASVTFDCSNIGANNLTLIATDDHGNIDSCVAVVTVEDITPPAMLCQDITVHLDASGNATVVPGDVDAGTSDNCAIASLTLNGLPSLAFDCSNVGVNNVTLIATDVNGNIDSCSALVTIQDTVSPTAICQTFDAYLDAAGNVTVNPADVDGGSTDNCGITVYTVNGLNSVTFNCGDVGTQTVTLEVTDAAGNSDNCTATVNVIDTVAPTVVCQNISRNLNASGFVIVPALAVDAGSTDACNIATFSLSQDSFTCANVGPNNVTLYVTDVNGNIDSCTAVITIFDVTPPTAACQNITVDLDPSGNVTVLATQVDAGSTDNCAIDSVAIDGQASITYTCADVGVQPVTFEAFDVNGNSSSCFAQITIRDTVPPNAICQNTTIQLDASGNAILNVVSINNGSNDNCGIASVLFNNNSSTINFDCSNVGTNNVTMVVTDVNGNVDSCTAVVTVEDNIAPNALCQSATVFVDASGIATVLPSDVDGGSADACGIDTMFVSPATLSCNNIATPATVTLTVVDVNGNSSTCNAQVTVVDTVSPTMICQNTTVYLDNFGVISVTPAQIDGGSIDACGLSQLLINGSSNQIYTCADTGVNVATLTGIDIYGNSASCQAQVTVLDTISPTAQCRQPFDVILSSTTGDVTIIPSDVDSFSTDNCNVNTAAYLINGQPSITYDCGDLFNNQNVVLTVVDESGNTNTCSTVITVRDTTAPSANCQPSISVNLSSATNNGTVTVNAITLNNNSTDACAPPLSYLINGQTSFQYDCSNIGSNTAVLTVTDASGNSGTCTSTIIVNDITPPSAQCVANIVADLDSSGIYNVQGVDLDNGSFDNCAVTTYLINGNPSQTYTCQDIGNNLATLTVQDSSGNSATCTSVVTVRDLLAPTAVCPTQPVPVYLNATGVVTVTGTVIDSASFDNCGIQTYLINGSLSQNYTCNNIGLNNAILTVRDSSNNSNACVMQVEVRDTVPPVANCQNITVNLGAGTGIAVVNANAINASSADNCGINNYLINGMPSDTFDCTNVGINNVLLTVTDDYGNQSTCNAMVTVVDNAAPVINCSNGLFYLDNTGTVQVQPTDVATGIDACGIANWTIDGAPSVTYDCSVAGTTLLDTIVASDFSGNSASCVSQVTILDTVSPVAQCNNATVQLDSNGTYTLVPSIVDDNSFDNCSIVTYLISDPNTTAQPSISYNCQDTGVNNITLTVIDQSGNQSTCSAVVTIEDNIAPVANCKNITVQLNSSGIVSVPAINLNDGSFDACGTAFTINGLAADTFDCSNTGPNLVTLEVTDPSGNVSTCQSIVTVQDVTPPTVICQPYTLYLDNSGSGSISFADVVDVANSGDNCGVFLYTINGSTTTINYNCSDVGTDTVMVIAEDFSGNEDTCYSVVTIIDSVGPTVNCNNIVVDLTATGSDTLTLSQLGASASDACGIDTIEIVPNIITCADVGVVQVQVIATDVNGNQTICTSDVTVINDGPQPTNNVPATGICEGQTLALFANPPATGFTYNYQWSGPNGYSSTQENPTIADIQAVNEGWYYVQITPQGAPGCATTDSTYVDVNVVPEAVLAVNDPLCDGSEAILSVTNDTAYNGITVTYEWFQNGTAVGPDSNIYTIPAVSFADTGSYTIIVTVDGCSDTSLAPLPVVVNPLPAAFTPISNDPCEGDTLVLTSNAPATGPFTYSWEGPVGSTYSSTDSIATLFPVGLGDAGLYTVTITDLNTCTATSSVSVNVIQTPASPDLNFNAPLCLDDILELTDTTSYAGPVSYVWLDPAGAVMDTTSLGQYTVVSAVEGTYGLIVIENGCLSPQDTQVVAYEPAPSTVNDAYTVPFRDSITGMDVTLNDFVRTGYSIGIVDSASNGNITLNANGTFDYTPGYIFFGIDSFQYEVCDPICPTICDTATVILDVELDQRCFMPNGLSPNGDGINDELVIVCRDQYPNMQIQIFSRWGNLVYEGDPNGWNAQFNGKDLPDGTYFYVLNYGDGTEPETGYIVVHR